MRMTMKKELSHSSMSYTWRTDDLALASTHTTSSYRSPTRCFSGGRQPLRCRDPVLPHRLSSRAVRAVLLEQTDGGRDHFRQRTPAYPALEAEVENHPGEDYVTEEIKEEDDDDEENNVAMDPICTQFTTCRYSL